MNTEKLARMYRKTANAIVALANDASESIGTRVQVDLCANKDHGDCTITISDRDYRFTGPKAIEESLEFLSDLADPMANDTELLDALDGMFPRGWRLCLEHGLCPVEPDYCLTGCKHLNFQGSIRECLRRVFERARDECGRECC